MIVIATRSSTTASVSRKLRSAEGRWVPITASTASANAMSVAVGIAQPAQRITLRAQEGDGHGIHEGGEGDAAQGGGDGQRGLGRRAELADEELALELEAGDEEEEREQAVGGPLAEGQVEVQRVRSERGVAQARVCRVPRRVRPGQRRDGRGEQQRAADGLGAQGSGDVLGLLPRGAGEEAGTQGVEAHGAFGGRRRGRRPQTPPTRLPGSPRSSPSRSGRGGSVRALATELGRTSRRGPGRRRRWR